MRVAFVHFHAKRGGVTRVMENALESLALTDKKIQCVVLCGEKPADESKLPILAIDGIGYGGDETKKSPAELADSMESSVRGALGAPPDVWHIHNPSLGKNPNTADMVVEMARRGHRLLLQIHDFAEDGRPANYGFRQAHLAAPSCYPVGPKIHYAVLNRRDYDILKNAGIPEDKLHWLPNAVIPAPLNFDDEENYDSGIDELIVYPVRAVRRKNFGELLLHAALPTKRRAYVTTLGTTSEDFVATYQQWVSFASELGLQVNFEVCQKYGMDFDSLIDNAHCIVSTSVAEGFGLGFLEPWLFGKTLIGRDLPEITEDFKDLGVVFNHLYKSIPIPLECFRFDEFRSRLAQMIKQYHEQYGESWSMDWMEAWIESAIKEYHLDFAKLDEIAQREVIEKTQNSYDLQQFLGTILNDELETDQVINSNASIIQRELSLEKYGQRLRAIYSVLGQETSDGAIEFASTKNILDAFFSVERFLPLRT